MRASRLLGSLVALTAACAVVQSAPARAEEVIRAISAFPRPIDFTQSFLRFVEKANASGKGIVRIQFAGGPEVIPPPEQADAVRRGVIDMQYGPATYYLGAVPEVDAMVGSTKRIEETRANGGIDLLNQVFQKKINAYLLGHFDTGVDFHIYLTKEPQRTADGGVDLKGMKLRSQPIYREFFTQLGATNVSIPVPEVYPALERGVVDGIGWPLVAVRDLGWQKYLKYRIDPAFFQTDLVVIVNLDRWNKLSPKAREVLQDAAKSYERESYAHFQKVIAETDKKVREEGMQVITLSGAAAERFRDAAFETPWTRLKERDPTHADALRARFYGR